MNNNVIKFLSVVLLFTAWIGLIIAKHFWPDLQDAGVLTAITSAIAGMGGYHIAEFNKPTQ